MAVDNRALRDALKQLHNAAPEEYRYFSEIFQLYTNQQVLAAAMAQQAEVLTVQGQARQCLALVDLIKEADPPTSPRGHVR